MTHRLDEKRLRKAIKVYRDELAKVRAQGDTNEGQLRRPFANLLAAVTPDGWEFHEETSPIGDPSLRFDGLLLKNAVRRGIWEAKDPNDRDLAAEVEKKRKKGYALDNALFENTRVALLYQDGRPVGDGPWDLADDDALARLLLTFLGHTRPQYDAFDRAIVGFKERVRSLSEDLQRHIEKAHAGNPGFRQAFAAFADLCRESINPGLADDDIDRLLIQHLLIQRLIDAIFDTDFFQKNAIAREIEAVVAALTGSGFSREAFHRELDFFYEAIEGSARTLGAGPQAWAAKQTLLNDVYERFFQGYDRDVADTHGIVYTPQEIVDFMGASVEHVLRDAFGLGLGDDRVVVLDPCTGTGNFVVNLLKRLPPDRLADAYAGRLFANEIQLLPYYIAALNIEHTYWERTGRYEPFPGLCFVDTLSLAEAKGWLPFGAEENTERIARQRRAPVTVVVGNPPYNFGQKSENDNNKNRKYPVVDERVRETYSADSRATLKNSLFDPFVKFFRWATDRLGDRDGVVCYVTNNAFLDGVTFDGMRQHLARDFDTIYHLDLRGNVRQNPKLSGSAYNVFGIQVGVGITLAVRHRAADGSAPSPPGRGRGEGGRHRPPARVLLHRFPLEWRRREKLQALAALGSVAGVAWTELQPDDRNRWLVPEGADAFARFLPIGSREAKAGEDVQVLFASYCGGVKTNRDDVVYGFDRERLASRVQAFIDAYLGQVDKYKRQVAKGEVDIDRFVDTTSIKWDGSLKEHLRHGREVEFQSARLRSAKYRPFVERHLYFEPRLINRVYLFPRYFPTPESEAENRVIWIKVGTDWPMFALTSDRICDLLPQGGSQCFPFYTYDEDGTNRRENITDWALEQFRSHYGPQPLPADPSPIGRDRVAALCAAVLDGSASLGPASGAGGGDAGGRADTLTRRLRRRPLPGGEVSGGGGPPLSPSAGRASGPPLPPGGGGPPSSPSAGRASGPAHPPGGGGPSSSPSAGRASGPTLPGGEVSGVGDPSSSPSAGRASGPPLPPGEGRGEGPTSGGSTGNLRPGGTPAAHASGHAHSALDPEQLAFARRLRRTQTHPEAILWALLRSRHLGGCKFRRQHPAPPYVLDFYCHQARLAIEVDGDSHDVPDRQAHDEARTRDLRSRGIRVLRFANADVLDETEGVLEAILRAVREPTEPTRGAEADATPPQPLASGPGWHEPSVSRPIAKWDLFHYVYAVLHHPSYRERFAEVLKKELPRVPLLPEFPRLVAAGRALAALHVHHDAAPPYDPDGGLLRWTGEPPSWRVEAMRLAKDHATLAVNPSLTLGPIPPEAFAYRLGNRSALEWVIDQYRVDPAAGEDPNRPDDPEHVVRHVQRVLSVSLATVRVVASLPEAFG